MRIRVILISLNIYSKINHGLKLTTPCAVNKNLFRAPRDRKSRAWPSLLLRALYDQYTHLIWKFSRVALPAIAFFFFAQIERFEKELKTRIRNSFYRGAFLCVSQLWISSGNGNGNFPSAKSDSTPTRCSFRLVSRNYFNSLRIKTNGGQINSIDHFAKSDYH